MVKMYVSLNACMHGLGKGVCLCIYNYRAAWSVYLSYILIDCDCEHVFGIIDTYLCSDCLTAYLYINMVLCG